MSRLDPLCADDCPGCERSEIASLRAAVESVLALHEPEATGYGDWVCGACISAGSHDWESTAYPCPTVTAIQSALGETDANN